jgi:hypothetical protein
MVTDRLSSCPHGWVGPWYSRPCGCKLIEVVYSEVAMNIGVAGHVMWACPVRPALGPIHGPALGPLSHTRMVQLYKLDNKAYSAPILVGEAGYGFDPVG